MGFCVVVSLYRNTPTLRTDQEWAAEYGGALFIVYTFPAAVPAQEAVDGIFLICFGYALCVGRYFVQEGSEKGLGIAGVSLIQAVIAGRVRCGGQNC